MPLYSDSPESTIQNNQHNAAYDGLALQVLVYLNPLLQMEHKFKFSIKNFSAWAPGLSSTLEWQRFSEAASAATPTAQESSSCKPNVKQVPAMLRRRCNNLARASLSVALSAVGPDLQSSVPTVFSSQFGESEITTLLLKQVASGEALSPTSFGLSVHNSSSGLYSLATKNRNPAIAIAAGRNSFLFGLLEAVSRLEASPMSPSLLYVMADEMLPHPLNQATEEPAPFYALGMLLERVEERADLGESPTTMTLNAMTQTNSISSWAVGETETLDCPQGLWFLRFLFSHEKALAFDTGGHFWEFLKADEDYQWQSSFREHDADQTA